MTTMCRACGANPPASEGLCFPCLRDWGLAASKEKRRVDEQRQRQRRRHERRIAPTQPLREEQ